MQTGGKCYLPRYRTCSGSPASRRCATRFLYPTKTCRCGSKDPLFTAVTISLGPQPASIYPTPSPPVMLPPLHYQGLDSAQPFGYQPPPRRVPAPFTPPAAGPPPANATGTVRAVDQMEGDAEDVPLAKRQRVAKLPGGQYYPEQDWINMHPVRFPCMLPA